MFLFQFVSKENSTMALEVSYSPVSIGLLRMWLHFAEAMKTMRTLGQCIDTIFPPRDWKRDHVRNW